MFFCALYLISALSISAIAAYFSVIGLATIFPGSIKSIIIMGGVLEIGKIVAAIWLHRNWKSAPFLVKGYLSFATLVLMGITSMGIFGFLSRAHIEHQTTSDTALASIQVINNKIERENDFISRQEENIKNLKNNASEKKSSSRLDTNAENEKIINITAQLNKDTDFEQNRITEAKSQLNQLEETLAALTNSSGGLFSSKAKKIETLKLQQKTERERIAKEIETYNKNINDFRALAGERIKSIEDKVNKFREENNKKDTANEPQIEEHTLKISQAFGRIDELELNRISLSDNARQLEAEIGPVKYVAEAIADFTGKEFNISQAVRIVIIILVLVFDPLAILLVIAANISIEKYLPKSQPKYKQSEREMKNILSEIKSKTQKLKKIKDTKAEEEETIEALLTEKLTLEGENEDLKEESKKIEEFNKKIQELEKKEIEAHSKVKNLSIKLKEDTEEFRVSQEELEKKKEQLESDSKTFSESRFKLDIEEKSKQEQIQDSEKKKKSLEELRDHLQKEKDKLKTETSNLQSTAQKLSEEIVEKQEMIQSLQESYKKAAASCELREIFKNSNITQVIETRATGKVLSMSDSKGRIHQYIIPTAHEKVPSSHFREVTNKLDSVADLDDLPHEFSIEIKKFISFNIPKYNCLT